jgi:hypothetical protein
MGQLASKEKNGSVKVALILDESSDRNAPSDHAVNSTVSKLTYPNFHASETHSMESSNRLDGDVHYDYETNCGSPCTYSGTSSTEFRQSKPKIWKKVTLAQIVDADDKKRVKIVDIPGLKILPAIRFYSNITHMKM